MVIGGLGLGLGLGFFYSILNSLQLTRNVTCSRLYLDGKIWEENVRWTSSTGGSLTLSKMCTSIFSLSKGVDIRLTSGQWSHQYQQRWCENRCSEYRCNVIITTPIITSAVITSINQVGEMEYNFRCLKWLCKRLSISFPSQIKIFWKASFGRLTEVPLLANFFSWGRNLVLKDFQVCFRTFFRNIK